MIKRIIASVLWAVVLYVAFKVFSGILLGVTRFFLSYYQLHWKLLLEERVSEYFTYLAILVGLTGLFIGLLGKLPGTRSRSTATQNHTAGQKR